MTKSKPKTKKKNTYIGTICKKCRTKLRYTSSGDCVECRKRFNNHPNTKKKKQNHDLMRKYNLTPAKKRYMYDCQKDLCKCGKPMTFEESVVDHVKGTQIVRGLLHNKCNTCIGLVDHDPKSLRSLGDYLESIPADGFDFSKMPIDKSQKHNTITNGEPETARKTNMRYNIIELVDATPKEADEFLRLRENKGSVTIPTVVETQPTKEPSKPSRPKRIAVSKAVLTNNIKQSMSRHLLLDNFVEGKTIDILESDIDVYLTPERKEEMNLMRQIVGDPAKICGINKISSSLVYACGYKFWNENKEAAIEFFTPERIKQIVKTCPPVKMDKGKLVPGTGLNSQESMKLAKELFVSAWTKFLATYQPKTKSMTSGT